MPARIRNFSPGAPRQSRCFCPRFNAIRFRWHLRFATAARTERRCRHDEEEDVKQLVTTLGPFGKDQLGLILPHEHVFVDLRTPDQPGYAEANTADVVALMAPEIEAIKAQRVTALVECSTGGVGRRADLDLAVSQATGFPIVVPTGNYREPWI